MVNVTDFTGFCRRKTVFPAFVTCRKPGTGLLGGGNRPEGGAGSEPDPPDRNQRGEA